jgi:hypothetical protein
MPNLKRGECFRGKRQKGRDRKTDVGNLKRHKSWKRHRDIKDGQSKDRLSGS